MRVFKNGETDVMEFDGNLEGLRILSKINADSANTALTHASHQPSYKDCIIDLVCDNEPVYQGDLNSFIQMMFMGAFDTTGRMQYLNAELGQLFVTHASGVSEQLIADLSVLTGVVLESQTDTIAQTASDKTKSLLNRWLKR